MWKTHVLKEFDSVMNQQVLRLILTYSCSTLQHGWGAVTSWSRESNQKEISTSWSLTLSWPVKSHTSLTHILQAGFWSSKCPLHLRLNLKWHFIHLKIICKQTIAVGWKTALFSPLSLFPYLSQKESKDQWLVFGSGSSMFNLIIMLKIWIIADLTICGISHDTIIRKLDDESCALIQGMRHPSYAWIPDSFPMKNAFLKQVTTVYISNCFI